MIKKTFLLLVATILGLASRAADKSLVITFDNGTTQSFLLSDKPKVSVADDKLTVEAGMTTAQYALNEVKTFTFAEISSGIDGMASGYDITKEGDAIMVPARVKVEAYTADGKSVSVSYIHNSGHTVISLESLPKGFLILKIDDRSVKVIRR